MKDRHKTTDISIILWRDPVSTMEYREWKA